MEALSARRNRRWQRSIAVRDEYWFVDAIPSLYAIGGKSCVTVCNLNQRSQRSDFEALVQACEELGVEHEARTRHKAVQHVKLRRGGTTMMVGTGQELLKRSPE